MLAWHPLIIGTRDCDRLPVYRLLIPLRPMINQHDKFREVAWNELFPWLMLLRAVRIALMARVLVLGALGLIATTLGWWAIDYCLRGQPAIRW